MQVNIKIRKVKAGFAGGKDPFGREFVYYAENKMGIHEIGDTPLEAATKAINKLKEAGKI